MTDTIETLRDATDQALTDAKAALTAGWQRLSDTDIDPAVHGEDVGAEMGALTLPLGLIGRIQRRRIQRHDDPVERLMADIVDYDREAEQYEEMARAARDRRDELIREALTHDTVSAARIADVTGLHIQRVYQIRRAEDD